MAHKIISKPVLRTSTGFSKMIAARHFGE